jgi:hypothetical protein
MAPHLKSLRIHGMVLNKRWVIASVIGLVALVAASASGATFIPSQTDLYSYSMAPCFFIAIFAYVWGLFAVSNYE